MLHPQRHLLIQRASEESRQKLRELYNLDKPVVISIWLMVKRIVKLDFGNSFASHQRPVYGRQKIRMEM